MRDILDKYLPSKKSTFHVLQRDYEGDDWIDSKTYEAFDFEDAAEKYANDYYDDKEGEWRDDDEINLEVKCEDEIRNIAVSFQYSPTFYVREIEDDEE